MDSLDRRKVALVTGAGVRLGKATAIHLARSGYNLVLHYGKSEEAVVETERACQEAGAQTVLIQADLSLPEEIRRVAEEALDRYPRLDLLVNNAGIFYPTPTLEEAEQAWEQFMDVNLKAPFRFVHHLVEPLSRWRGSVVNIVDIWSRFPLEGYLPYCVSKAALASLTRCLALELAPKIRVNGVSPGAALLPSGTSPEKEDQLTRDVPLKRLGAAHSIAEAVLYLAEADFVTGQILEVDGGRTLKL